MINKFLVEKFKKRRKQNKTVGSCIDKNETIELFFHCIVSGEEKK